MQSTAHADFEIPNGKFGFSLGLRQNTGSLGNDYGFGWLLGIVAGYQPPFLDTRYSIGADWGVLWGRFQRDDPELVLEELFLVEMHFGLKLRAAFQETVARFITLGGGVTMLRADTPLPPDDKRSYFGPYASFGIDQYLANRYLVSLEARYGLIGSGPQSFTVLLSFHFGEK
jgi:hypothetical protein